MPRLATNAATTVVWRFEARAFGEGGAQTDPDGDGTAVNVRLRYPGQYFDSESGLFDNYLRDYDPSTGRYIESDPVGLAGGLSTYAYVDSNPMRHIDPLGLFNPAKGASAVGNGAVAAWSAAQGVAKWTAAAALAETGVGGTALYAWGAWNFKGSKAAFERGNQQLHEAFCEDWSDASWKNFWGMAPGGTQYDDPGEYEGPWDFIQKKGWWEWAKDAGYF